MSTKVVPAPAVQAKRPVRSDKPATRTDEQKAVDQDEERAAQDDSEKQVASANEDRAPAPASETSLAGGFTFGAALAEAAATAGSLTSEAEEADEAGFSQFGDDGGSTILLVGAIALVGLGVLVLADGGGGSKNGAPTIDGGDTRTIETDEGEPITFTVTATDPDNDVLTFTAAGATKGAVTVGANGALTYTPNAGANGTDTFTITVSDGKGGTDTQAVTVNIAPVDSPVSFNADTATAAATEDTPFDGSLAALIVDADGDGVLSVETQGAHGTVTLGDDGAYTYTPNADYFGDDSFVVKIDDGTSSDTITVNVTVASVNDDPDFGVDEQSFDVATGGTLEGVLEATDVDGDDLTYSVETDATNGTLTVSETGELTYTPDDEFLGEDTFVVKVSDGNGGEDTLSITVNVLDALPTTDVVIDNLAGTLTTSGAGGAFVFTDDVTVRTDVIINDFGSDDRIEIDGLEGPNNYSYTARNVAGDEADDLLITYNSNGNFTQIVLVDAAVNADGGNNFVFNYDSAVASLGFDFITIV